jgi:NADH-quinone oxidoreductase subunit G
LTSKDFRFKMRVWFLKSVKSVCTGCARGCNTFMDQKDGVVYRYRPRENQSVNQYWMCDEGRLSYKAINENRLREVSVNGKPMPFGPAIKQLIGQIQGAIQTNGIAAVGSPFSSLEDNYALQAFMGRVANSDRVFGYNPTKDGFQDDLLIRADKTPNRVGVAYLGIKDTREALLAALANNEVQLLFVMNNNLATDPELAAALKKVTVLVYLGSHQDETAALAHYVFPTATHAEKYGTFINFQGRLQRFYQAFEAEGDAVAEMEFLSRLGRMIDKSFGYDDIEDIWAELRTRHTEFGDLSWYHIPDAGFPIPSLTRENSLAGR